MQEQYITIRMEKGDIIEVVRDALEAGRVLRREMIRANNDVSRFPESSYFQGALVEAQKQAEAHERAIMHLLEAVYTEGTGITYNDIFPMEADNDK